MAKYIDKDALVAEIEKWRDGITEGIFSIPLSGSDRAYATFEYEILGKVKDFLDTLEVKEVDLEKEIEKCLKRHSMLAVGKKDFTDIAKHFFELGMAVSNKAQKGE